MILAVAVLSFIRGLQSFNTELLLGTPAGIYVYSTRIYDYIRREPASYGEATALGSIFIVILGALLFFYWRFLSGKRKFTVVTGQGYSVARVKLGRWRHVAHRVRGDVADVPRRPGAGPGSLAVSRPALTSSGLTFLLRWHTLGAT